MFGKVFASLYQGSLRGQAHEILVFTNMIACADKEGFVDKHPRAIADECGLTVEQVRTAIANLEATDPESRTPDEEGRRILRIDDHRPWGWRLTNYLKYRDMRDEETRREQNREAQARKRSRQQASAHVSTHQRESAKVEVEVEGSKTDPSTAKQSQDLPAADAGGASAATMTRKARKGILEQAGLAGDCARAWAGRYGESPEWGRHVVALNKLGQRRDHGKLVAAFGRFVDCDEEWLADKTHHLSLFLANADRWLIDRASDPMSNLSPAGQKTARSLQRLVEKMEAKESTP